MAENDKPPQHLDAATIGRIILGCVIGVPNIFVLLHIWWPSVVWLRALACGLVLVPTTIAISALFVAMTEPKGGSILNGWAIILPTIGGIFSVDFGWKATVFVLLGFGVWNFGFGVVVLLVRRARKRPPPSQNSG